MQQACLHFLLEIWTRYPPLLDRSGLAVLRCSGFGPPAWADFGVLPRHQRAIVLGGLTPMTWIKRGSGRSGRVSSSSAVRWRHLIPASHPMSDGFTQRRIDLESTLSLPIPPPPACRRACRCRRRSGCSIIQTEREDERWVSAMLSARLRVFPRYTLRELAEVQPRSGGTGRAMPREPIWSRHGRRASSRSVRSICCVLSLWRARSRPWRRRLRSKRP